MPLLRSHTLLQTHSVLLLSTAYLLLTNPLLILNSTPLWLLGESMHMPRASFVPSIPNHATTSAPGATLKHSAQSVLGGSSAFLSLEIREVLALLALLLCLAAVTQAILVTPLRYDKTALGVLAVKRRTEDDSEFAEKVHTLVTAQALFLMLSGVRVVLEGVLVAGIYLMFADRRGVGLGSGRMGVVGERERGVLALLANRIVFAVVMGDMLFWGYIWTVLREEARDVAEVLARRRKVEGEERL